MRRATPIPSRHTFRAPYTRRPIVLSAHTRMISFFQPLIPARCAPTPHARVSSPRNTWTTEFRGRASRLDPNRSRYESMNPNSAGAWGRVPGEISTRRLQDLIRRPQLAHFPFQLGDPLLILGRDTGPLPQNPPLPLFTQSRSVSASIPTRARSHPYCSMYALCLLRCHDTAWQYLVGCCTTDVGLPHKLTQTSIA